MASQKTAVVLYLWHQLSAEGRWVATFDDVRNAIKTLADKGDVQLKADNPANFMKDFLRGANASKNWPQELTQMRITARQVVGNNRIFEFVSFTPDQEQPFPDPFALPHDLEAVPIQSISIQLATKSLGREDESWLIQVAVNLRVMETHLATRSELNVVELTHLQVGVKLGQSEVDSLFLAVIESEDGTRCNALVTCEAKQAKDPILADQIVQQVVATAKSVADLDLGVEFIIPTAIKAVRNPAGLYVVEFEPWTTEQAGAGEEDRPDLIVHTTALYELRPSVPGVGTRRVRRRPATKPAL